MKPWYQSRTVWANIIAIVFGAVASLAQEVHGGPVIDPGLQGTIAVVALAVINLIMRKITGQPLG